MKSLFGQALDCHIPFGTNDQAIAFFEWLADWLDCSQYMARRVWTDLKLGEVKAKINSEKESWCADPSGRLCLTLPIFDDDFYGGACQIHDLIAVDPDYPAQIYYKTGTARVLGSGALERSQNDTQWPITLFADFREWLKGWARFWFDQLQSAAQRPAGNDTKLFRDRGPNSRHFPGVCFLDPSISILKIIPQDADIHVAGEAFAHSIAAQLKQEIAAVKYPRILLSQEG